MSPNDCTASLICGRDYLWWLLNIVVCVGKNRTRADLKTVDRMGCERVIPVLVSKVEREAPE